MSLDKFQCRYSVEQAYDLLEHSDISDDEVDLSEAFSHSQNNDKISDENALSPQSSCSDDEDDFEFSSEDEIEDLAVNPSGQQKARNGVIWNPLFRGRPGQANASNVFHTKTGVHPAIQNRAAVSAYDCWKLYVDNSMLKSIQEHTCREATKINSDFTLTLDKLEAFIGLHYARGMYGKGHCIDFLWNTTYGPKLFGDTMSKYCFREVKCYIRFDNKDRRSQRLADDKFVYVGELLEKFVANYMFNYSANFITANRMSVCLSTANARRKKLSLLSTMHNAPTTDNTEKKKPLVIHFCNKNKVGVDIMIY